MKWLALMAIFYGLLTSPVSADTYPAYTASPSAKVATPTPTKQPTVTPTLKVTLAPTITVTPTTKPVSAPFISGQIGCEELVVESGSDTVAPARVVVNVTAHGPLANVKNYKVDWGDGNVKEGTSPRFSYTYTTPGTYEVKGYVLDGMGLSYGATNTCTKTVKVLAAAPLTTQPQTGVPGSAWLAIGSLLLASLIVRKYAYLVEGDAKNS